MGSCRRVDATKPLNEQMPITKATKEEMEKYKDTYVGKKKISFIMELMIKKYFEKFLFWLSYNDLQVLANAPLVVRQLIIYAINMKRERPESLKIVKKHLTIKVLQVITGLMKAPHEVIQYNSCLLMATLDEMGDKKMSATLDAMGAKVILEAYKQQHARKEEMMQAARRQQKSIPFH